jgi:hypothetical protein
MSERFQIGAIYLRKWEEANGTLIGLDEAEMTLIFREFKVQLTPVDYSLIPSLRGVIGRRISLLRVDPSAPLKMLTRLQDQETPDTGSVSHYEMETAGQVRHDKETAR